MIADVMNDDSDINNIINSFARDPEEKAIGNDIQITNTLK